MKTEMLGTVGGDNLHESARVSVGSMGYDNVGRVLYATILELVGLAQGVPTTVRIHFTPARARAVAALLELAAATVERS